jgi:flagellar hook-associated protein 3 FlgL
MGFRVTDQGVIDNRLAWINESRDNLNRFEQQIATGRRFSQASEDPNDATRVLRSDLRLQRVAQFERNGDNANLWISTADEALQTASRNLARARTIAIQSANDTLEPVERQALATDIRSIAAGLRTVANTKVSGRAIFAGTANTAEAYDATGTYVGDSGAVTRTIDTSETVEVSSNGPDVFGPSNPGDPLDGTVFEMLEAVAAAIELGDTATVRDGIEAIDVATARIGVAQGKVGAVMQQLDAAATRHSGEQIGIETQVAKLRDVDIAEAVVRLRSAEVSYEATLSATARALGRSLLDFLA